jgi:inorganic pyrophosphatase
MAHSFHRYRPHPWHGLSPGLAPPVRVRAYIEITPSSSVKYEVDKESGYLMVDRPQASNALPPCPYGFIPRTWCGPRIARLAGVEKGDGDPLDICVISERTIESSDILLNARVVGGLLMVDRGEADDKIIAVLDRDPVWSAVTDLEQLPKALVDRLRHYFLTYKLDPDGGQPVTIDAVYGAERAQLVVTTAIEDYEEAFGALTSS